MAVRVLHFGKDNCNRLLVLRSVGYAVDTCRLWKNFTPCCKREQVLTSYWLRRDLHGSAAK